MPTCCWHSYYSAGVDGIAEDDDGEKKEFELLSPELSCIMLINTTLAIRVHIESNIALFSQTIKTVIIFSSSYNQDTSYISHIYNFVSDAIIGEEWFRV